MNESETGRVSRHLSCPLCGEKKVRHIRRSGMAYRMRRRLTSDRLYRCHSCHQDFWVTAQGKPEVADYVEPSREQGPALSTRAYYLMVLFSFIASFILIAIFGKK